MTVYRAGGPADATAIATLHTESWRQNYRGIFSDHYLNNDIEQERLQYWQQSLQHPVAGQYVTVAVHDNIIVGFACLLTNHDTTFGSLLDNLHVATRYQGSGIGRQLLSACAVTITTMASGKNMYLWAFEQNYKARNVYLHLGGIHHETIEKLQQDGSRAFVCRYTWQDVSGLIV